MKLDVLTSALEAFCDPSVPGAAFPTDEDDARTKWATAFFTYVSDITPSSGPPPPTDKVIEKFHDTVRFVPTLVGIPEPTDLASAWQAAMASIFAFDDLVTRTTTLRSKLAGIMATPTLAAAPRIADIAGAFHDVTFGITSGTGSITYT